MASRLFALCLATALSVAPSDGAITCISDVTLQQLSFQCLGQTSAAQQMCIGRNTNISSVSNVAPGTAAATAAVDKVVDDLQAMRGENLLLKALKGGTLTGSEFQTWGENTYLPTLYAFAIPGIVLGVLCFLSCPFFCCANTCCKDKCCCRAAESYSGLSKTVITVLYLLITLVAAVCAIVGISFAGRVIDGGTSATCSMEGLGRDSLIFFEELLIPLSDLKSEVNTGVTSVQSMVASATAVSAGLTSLISELNTFGTNVQNHVFPSGYTSEVTTNMGTAITDVAAELDVKTKPVTDSLSSAKDAVDGITDQQAMLDDIVDMAQDSVGEISKIFKPPSSNNPDAMFYDMTTTAKDSVSIVLGQATLGAYLFFSITFLASIAGILSVIFYFTPCKCDDKIGSFLISTSWCTTFVFAGLLFILAGVILPVSIVFADSCGIIDDVPQNLTLYGDLLGLNQMSSGAGVGTVALDPMKVVEGCFASPSVPVATSLNLSASFNFDANSIFGMLPTSAALDTAFDLNELDQLEWTVNNLTLASFGLYQSNITDSVTALNNAVVNTGGSSGYPYVESDCAPAVAASQCAPDSDFTGGTAPSSVRSAANALNDMVAAKENLNGLLSWMQADVAAISSTKAMLMSNTTSLFNVLDNIENELEPLFNAMDRVFSAGDCEFIALHYNALATHLCSTTLSGMTSLSLIMYVIGVFGIFTVIFASLMNNRLFGARGTGGTTVYPDTQSSSPAVY